MLIIIQEFTPRANQAIMLAEKEARRLNHMSIGGEHLLLGIIKLEQGTGFLLLSKAGVNFDKVRMEIESLVTPVPDSVEAVGKMPYTPRFNKILSLANQEAKDLGHAYIGTEHLLLGLLREGENIACSVLKNLGVKIEVLSEDLRQYLDPNYKASDVRSVAEILNDEVKLESGVGQASVRFGELTRVLLTLDGRKIFVEPKIAACLIFLSRRKGQVVSFSSLINFSGPFEEGEKIK